MEKFRDLLQGKKVLVVEDEAMLREILCSQFESIGCTCVEASDGKTAYEIALKEKPDLIISDVQMPKYSGVDFLTMMSAQGLIKDAPVWMMSAHSNLTPKYAKELGAMGLISKPFLLEEVLPDMISSLK